MPCRYLREGIIDSDRVNRLDDEEEVFYRRLMSIVDDYGRFEANRAKLRARLYPLKLDQKSEQRIGDLLLGCVRERLVYIYRANGKTYLQILTFDQPTRSKSKCPPPDDKQLKAFAVKSLTPAQQQQLLSDAQQLITNVAVFVFGFECDSVSESEIESEGAADAAQPAPQASPERRPKDIEAVIAHGSSIGLPESECRTFFLRMKAKGWKSGRTPLADWRAELGVWKQRADERFAGDGGTGKNSAGSAAADFDPKKPNAHTGGIPVLN